MNLAGLRRRLEQLARRRPAEAPDRLPPGFFDLLPSEMNPADLDAADWQAWERFFETLDTHPLRRQLIGDEEIYAPLAPRLKGK